MGVWYDQMTCVISSTQFLFDTSSVIFNPLNNTILGAFTCTFV